MGLRCKGSSPNGPRGPGKPGGTTLGSRSGEERGARRASHEGSAWSVALITECADHAQASLRPRTRSRPPRVPGSTLRSLLWSLVPAAASLGRLSAPLLALGPHSHRLTGVPAEGKTRRSRTAGPHASGHGAACTRPNRRLLSRLTAEPPHTRLCRGPREGAEPRTQTGAQALSGGAPNPDPATLGEENGPAAPDHHQS